MKTSETPQSQEEKKTKSKEYPTLKKFSFFKEVTILIVLGIVLPTGDVYSDGALSYQFFTEVTHFQCLNGEKIRLIYVKNERWGCKDNSDKQGELIINFFLLASGRAKNLVLL